MALEIPMKMRSPKILFWLVFSQICLLSLLLFLLSFLVPLVCSYTLFWLFVLLGGVWFILSSNLIPFIFILFLVQCDSSYVRNEYMINDFSIYLLSALNMPGVRLRTMGTMMTPYVTFHKFPSFN